MRKGCASRFPFDINRLDVGLNVERLAQRDGRRLMPRTGYDRARALDLINFASASAAGLIPPRPVASSPSTWPVLGALRETMFFCAADSLVVACAWLAPDAVDPWSVFID
ncbi:MAG: hypothetical protein DME75_05580 [Verrucomicrobia bacterium]|nr:MAG: hypothetical protein DME75_05580 [Verrucomicrobiota bacterium]